MNSPKRLLLLSLWFVTSLQGYSQTDESAPSFDDSIREFASLLAPLVPFKVVQDVCQLKEFIRSEEFAGVRTLHGDLNAVDLIFAEAMRLSWNNAYEALGIATVATMDHRKFGVQLPLVGPLLWFPLTSEWENDFRERVDALPRLLYVDSPQRPGGDRDKLQHFFGSAFLTYLFESRGAAQRFGEFVEWGEDKVIVDGSLDERDFRANRHGQEFGLALLENTSARPSLFMMYTLAHELAPVVTESK